MTEMLIGFTRRGAVIVAIAVALAGCGGAKATPIVKHVTPSPAASVEETPTATPEATAAVESPSPEASASDVATASPSPSPTPASTTSLGSGCTASAEMQSYFASAASDLSFGVYCAVLPSSWWLQDTQYTAPNGGQMTIIYKNNSGGLINVGEGNFCPGLPDCWTATSDLGAASFGDLSGTLKLRDATPTYAVYVNAGTTHGYQITGKGLSQATFVSFAAAMIKVPKG